MKNLKKIAAIAISASMVLQMAFVSANGFIINPIDETETFNSDSVSSFITTPDTAIDPDSGVNTSEGYFDLIDMTADPKCTNLKVAPPNGVAFDKLYCSFDLKVPSVTAATTTNNAIDYAVDGSYIRFNNFSSTDYNGTLWKNSMRIEMKSPSSDPTHCNIQAVDGGADPLTPTTNGISTTFKINKDTWYTFEFEINITKRSYNLIVTNKETGVRADNNTIINRGLFQNSYIETGISYVNFSANTRINEIPEYYIDNLKVSKEKFLMTNQDSVTENGVTSNVLKTFEPEVTIDRENKLINSTTTIYNQTDDELVSPVLVTAIYQTKDGYEKFISADYKSVNIAGKTDFIKKNLGSATITSSIPFPDLKGTIIVKSYLLTSLGEAKSYFDPGAGTTIDLDSL